MADLSTSHIATVERMRLLLFNNELDGSLFGKLMSNAQMRRALFEMENQQLLLTYYIENNSIYIYK